MNVIANALSLYSHALSSIMGSILYANFTRMYVPVSVVIYIYVFEHNLANSAYKEFIKLKSISLLNDFLILIVDL